MNNKEMEIARLSEDSFASESEENFVELRNKSPEPNIDYNQTKTRKSACAPFCSNSKTNNLTRWRPNSLTQFMSPKRRRESNGTVFDSTPPQSPDVEETGSLVSRRSRSSQASASKEEHGTTVSVVVVEAKGLPNAPSDGSSHSLYCKIRLGSHTLKTKSVNSSQHPVWQERLRLRHHGEHLLRASLWDKGKQKSFMGSCVLDLSHLSNDRTHEVWQKLDDGYGMIHLAVTIWDNSHKNQNKSHEPNLKEKYSLFNFHELNSVGELHVRVVSAKGLGGKPYCVMQVDNEKVQTHVVNSSTAYTWDKNFIFKVYDVTSILDLKVFDNSLVSSFRNDCVGRVIIPLLKINNGEKRWYVLKDRSKRQSTRGNCPRVLLEMTLYWNPIKASLRVFKPKEVKYDKKPRKFDIGLVYKNIEFIRDVFVSLLQIDLAYKQFLEWENRELSCVVLFCWLFFWYNFQMWATPLLLLIPFIYSWILGRDQKEKTFMRGYGIVAESPDDTILEKPDKSLTGRIQEIPEMTITITDGIEYIASLSEKLYNLTSFKVPFLSYLTMFLLVMASIGFYLIPFNYMMIIFGLYKFSRKYFDPERVLNNDIVDFISRLPDTTEWRNWKELNVPEPSPSLNHRRNGRVPSFAPSYTVLSENG